MKIENLDFTVDELRESRGLICSETLKASEILDKIGNSDYFIDRNLFSCWYDKYLLLKSFFYKLFN